jgi:hypothetical protein
MEILWIANYTVKNKRPIFASVCLERFKRMKKSGQVSRKSQMRYLGARIS